MTVISNVSWESQARPGEASVRVHRGIANIAYAGHSLSFDALDGVQKCIRIMAESNNPIDKFAKHVPDSGHTIAGEIDGEIKELVLTGQHRRFAVDRMSFDPLSFVCRILDAGKTPEINEFRTLLKQEGTVWK